MPTMVPLAVRAEAFRRRVDRQSSTSGVFVPPKGWHSWATTLFPKHVAAPFAKRHAELWGWAEGITPTSAPDAFVGIWPRGGGKSSTAELVTAYVGCEGKRFYGWYIRQTQDNADKSIENVAALFESPEVARFYPAHGQRSVGKFGNSKGWRRNRLKTAGGFTLDAMGLDTAARGVKDEEQRPDFIVIDDVDHKHDSPAVIAKKIETITTSLLPAGAKNVAILAIQNLIIGDGFFAQVVTGEADYLAQRVVSGPHPAIRDLKLQWQDDTETGGRRAMIVGGKATWAGQSIEDCQHLMNTIGPSAFLKECQHEVFGRTEGVALRFEDRHVVDLTDLQAKQMVERAARSQRMSLFGGIDFGAWRFGFVLRAADAGGRAHEIAEWFSQRDSLETRAKGIDAICAHYGYPTGFPIWGDAANPTDILELNLAFHRIGSDYRVIAVDMGYKGRVASVDRLNDLMDRNAITYRRDVTQAVAAVLSARLKKPASEFTSWRLGANAAGEGVEKAGSRLRWEISKWKYPTPKAGEPQSQDPDDDSADGADLLAADRYAIMSWWGATQEPDRKVRSEDRDQTRIVGNTPSFFPSTDPTWQKFERDQRRSTQRKRFKTIPV